MSQTLRLSLLSKISRAKLPTLLWMTLVLLLPLWSASLIYRMSSLLYEKLKRTLDSTLGATRSTEDCNDDTHIIPHLQEERSTDCVSSFYRRSTNSMVRIRHNQDGRLPNPGSGWVHFATTYGVQDE